MSSVLKMVLIVFGWPLAVLFLIIVSEVVRDELAGPPTEIINTDPIQHPGYHALAVNAVSGFFQLSRSAQNSILDNLESTLVPTEHWLATLRQSDYELLCLGEDHEEATRRFLAERFFAHFPVDVLLLEATPEELAEITERMDTGEIYVPLLGANIANVLRAVRHKNPRVIIDPIEETKAQRDNRAREERNGLRDNSIVRNFWNSFKPGKRHVLLFGALHCTDHSNWLFEQVRVTAHEDVAKKMLNVRVLGEHQTGALEAFIFFLDEIGVAHGDFVIPDTSTLHPALREWFALMTRSVGKFRTLMVFRS